MILQAVVYKTGNMCGFMTGIMFDYKTNHSKKVCARMAAIRPITRKFGFFYAFQPKMPVLGQIFQLLQKVIFADLTFIRPITPKFRGGNDFYKTNHSKIDEIRPITPKSDWSYNHPL